MNSWIDKHGIFKYLRENFALSWTGVHGAGHWSRVLKNGLLIAEKEGARTDVIWLFAFLHDHMRENDCEERMHGLWAVNNAYDNLKGTYFDIDDLGWTLLARAMELHSDGFVAGNITVQACWDADRLDLGRVGVIPDPARLCTATAKDPQFIEAAYKRSIGVKNALSHV